MAASDGEHEQLLKIYHEDNDARPPADAARPPAGVGYGPMVALKIE